MNIKSETYFSGLRPSVHILKITFICFGNWERYVHTKNDCEKCLLFFREFDLKCSICCHIVAYIE